MRQIFLTFCIWSSISIFTYTELFAWQNGEDAYSHNLRQMVENYIDSIIWADL